MCSILFPVTVIFSKVIRKALKAPRPGLEMGIDAGRCHLLSFRAAIFEEVISSGLKCNFCSQEQYIQEQIYEPTVFLF
jgi:hypothetical protein